MDRIILHCDCNCFYASCELLSHPDLRQLPVAVCGDPTERHGIILAKNEPAKRCGVKTAETIWKAKQKCPGLILLPPHHRLYAEYSKKINAVYGEYTDLVEPFGIDESWLDVTNSLHLFGGDARALADTLRGRIKREFGLTISVGVSFNKVFAKLGSDYKKPDAVTLISPDNFRALVWPLPVTDLLYVGRAAADTLKRFGVRTIGDLARSDRSLIESHLKSHGTLLWEYANGIDDRPVITEEPEAKGIGNSTTLAHDVTSRAEAKSTLLVLCRSVSGRLKKAGQLAGTVTVEIKYSSFQSVSHQTSLLSPSNGEKALYEAACMLFDQLWDEEPIRLLGVRGTRLVREGEPVQMNLFDLDYNSYKKDEKHKKLDAALESIQKRYGKNAVITANRIKKEN